MIEPALGPDGAGFALVTDVAKTRTTPFYVYRTSIFNERIALLQSLLPANARLLYSAKANPHPALLAAAVAAGCGLELGSPGELDAMRMAGADPAEAVLVGPAKTDALLRQALSLGVGMVVVESEQELYRLKAVAASIDTSDRRRAEVDVLLRLNLPGARGSLRMSGHQFGMARDDIQLCRNTLMGPGVLQFAGYHGYLASQLLRAEDILHNIALVLNEIRELSGDSLSPPQIDFGGGFGIRLVHTDGTLDLAQLRDGLKRLLPEGVDKPISIFESGRFIVGPAGALVCRVVEVKAINGKRFVLLDGGTNTSGLFGGANAQRGLAHTVLRNGQPLAGGQRSTICGPLCTPMDLLAASVPCPADVGDLVVWWNMGAYGKTAAPINFLSFPPPGEDVA